MKQCPWKCAACSSGKVTWADPSRKGGNIESHTDEPSADLELGFRLLKREGTDEPGYANLEVLILDQPSEQHFDPERMELGVVSEFGGVENRSIAHPWPWPEQTKATPGFVTLRDRKDECVEFFTFGGVLEIQPCAEHTRCSLSSEAPVLNLNRFPGDEDDLAIPYMLAMQAQILLAHRRAAWVDDPPAYEAHLCQVRSLEFYGSCIHTLIHKFERFPTSADASAQEFVNFLRDENERVQELLPDREELPKIEQIL